MFWNKKTQNLKMFWSKKAQNLKMFWKKKHKTSKSCTLPETAADNKKQKDGPKTVPVLNSV